MRQKKHLIYQVGVIYHVKHYNSKVLPAALTDCPLGACSCCNIRKDSWAGVH